MMALGSSSSRSHHHHRYSAFFTNRRMYLNSFVLFRIRFSVHQRGRFGTIRQFYSRPLAYCGLFMDAALVVALLIRKQLSTESLTRLFYLTCLSALLHFRISLSTIILQQADNRFSPCIVPLFSLVVMASPYNRLEA